MQGSLILSALRAVEKRKKFKPSAGLAAYLKDNAIGVWSRDQVSLGRAARSDLQNALLRDFQVPIGTTEADFSGLSRTQTLALTSNEKVKARNVRSKRVAIKAMPGQPIRLVAGDIILPRGMSIDSSVDDVDHFSRYKKVILVENWEAFERIHALSFDPDPSLMDALVIYRGEPGSYTIRAARDFIMALDIPVYSFPDLDPAGLKIGIDLPRFAGFLLPSPEQVADLFATGRGDKGRYTAQLQGAFEALEKSNDPRLAPYWDVVKAAGLALPQEEFVRDTATFTSP